MPSAPTESRTRTPSRALEPKSSVSTNSTMSARIERVMLISKYITTPKGDGQYV